MTQTTEAGTVSSNRREYRLLLEKEDDGYRATRLRRNGEKGHSSSTGGTPSEAVDNFVRDHHDGGDYVVNVVTEEKTVNKHKHREEATEEKVVSGDKKQTKAEAGSNPHPERSGGAFGAGEGNVDRTPGGVESAQAQEENRKRAKQTEEVSAEAATKTPGVFGAGEGTEGVSVGDTPGAPMEEGDEGPQTPAQGTRNRMAVGTPGMGETKPQTPGIAGRDYPLEAQRTESVRANDKDAPPDNDNEIVIIQLHTYKEVTRRDIRLWEASGNKDASAIPGRVVTNFTEVAKVGEHKPRE